MVQIERSFLSSCVARRIFFLFILCALLPVGALSLISFGDVTSQLTEQSERRVRQESKAMGMAIYQRLLLAEAELRSSAWESGLLAGPSHEAASKSGFSGIARIRPSEPPEVIGGTMPVVPPITPAQWMLLRAGKTLLIPRFAQDQVPQLFLSKALLSGGNEDHAILAQLNPAYLWGAERSGALPGDMNLCVFGSGTGPLYCSEGASGAMQDEWLRQTETGGTSVFEWRDGEEVYTAGYWTIPLKFEFVTEPWTVVLSEPRSAVLAPLASFRYRFSIVVLLAVLFVALLSVVQIRKTMVPLEQLGEGTKRIARRDFSTPVHVASGDEFETLAGSFNAMSARIAHQFSQLTTMHEIDRSVLSVLDPSRIVDTVLVRLRDVTPCESVAVLLTEPSDEGRGWWYERVGRAATQTTVEGVAIGQALREALLAQRDRLSLKGDSAGTLFGRLCGSGANSVQTFPLFRADELLGCIALGYADGQQVNREARDQLRRLADQVAVALSNASDLAERKRVEGRLRETNSRLEGALAELKTAQQQMVQQERLRALGQMASGIAHDFNNTLSPIVGFSELLLIDPQMSENKAQLTEYLQTINLAAKDAAKVVSRLREFYRPRMEADLAGVVDLNRLVEQSIKLSQPKWRDQALAHGVTIEVRSELDAVPPVAGHESELREVLTNLLFNAVDAMPGNGSIVLRTKADGDHVRLEVSDSGTGMTEEVRQHCLEPFFSTKGEKGSGLGLAMVYGIIRRLRGTIDIASEVGKGTTFSLRLPIQTAATSDGHETGGSLEGVVLNVLVVDDDPLVGRVTGEYLRVAGHRVTPAASGAEAIKLFRPEDFDLVVTDHGMPHMTGLQLAAVIKEVSRETPVLLLTGGDSTEDQVPGSVQVDAMLSKPLTMDRLRQALAGLTYPNTVLKKRKSVGEAA